MIGPKSLLANILRQSAKISLPRLIDRLKWYILLNEVHGGAAMELPLAMNTHTISVLDSKTLLTMFGPRDSHLRKIRQELGVTITAREDRILIEGEERPSPKRPRFWSN